MIASTTIFNPQSFHWTLQMAGKTRNQEAEREQHAEIITGLQFEDSTVQNLERRTVERKFSLANGIRLMKK